MLVKLYKEDLIDRLLKTSGAYASFGYLRKLSGIRSYRHRGQDYVFSKGSPVKCLFNGVVDSVDYNHKYHGTRVTIKTAFKYIDSDNSNILFHRYVHLWKVKIENKNDIQYPGTFISSGESFALSGNSGYVLTFDSKIKAWRRLTKEEVRDENFKGGSHLHLEVFLKENSSKYTINDMHNVFGDKFIKNIDYFKYRDIDGNKVVFIRPEKICEYLLKKQESIIKK